MSITNLEHGLTADQAFGEVIHVRLRRRGIHQKVLAAALGMTQAAVSNKIRGTRPWSLTDMTKAAQFLGEDLGGLVSEAVDLLPRLDSNQQPFGYCSTQVSAMPAPAADSNIVDLSEWRRRAAC